MPTNLQRVAKFPEIGAKTVEIDYLKNLTYNIMVVLCYTFSNLKWSMT